MASLLSPKFLRANSNLEFILNGEENPLSDGTMVLQGISDPDYLDIQTTNEQGSASFSVPDMNFFYFFGFKQGYHPESGAIFSDLDKITQLDLTPFGPNEWQFYYRTNDQLEMSFLSSDVDTTYERGDEFNYEIEVGSISDSEVHITNNDINAGVYDSNGNPVMIGPNIWGSANPDLIYDIYFRPRGGWLRYTAQGNNVTAQIGEAHGTFDGIPFDISGEDEWVGQTIQTNDNIVPNNINQGDYHVLVDILGLNFSSQNFQVNVPVGINRDFSKKLEQKVYAYPNPSNGQFNINGHRPNERVEIYDLMGRKVYDGSIRNINSNSYDSGVYIGVIKGTKFPLTKLK